MSETEDRELLEFQKIEGIPSRVRERAEIVRLNHYGWSVAAIAEYKNKSPHTVRNSLHRWSIQGFEGLWEKEGRGRKPKWKKEDIEYIENCLEKEQRTYNASQLSQKLAKERGVTLSSDRLRKVLKKADATPARFPRLGNAHQARGGVGRGQDINNHQLMTPNKKKRNEPI